MKKFVVGLGLLMVSSLALAQAESDAPADGKAHPRAKMQDELNLTDEQVKQMREIRDAGGSREEMNAVLTPEQQAKAGQLRKEHKGDRGKRMVHMKEQLGLSDEQVAQIKEIKESGGSKDAIRAVLTPEQQTKYEDMRSKRKHKGSEPE